MTIWVCPVSQSQSRETVKPSLVRVLSSTNTVLVLSGVDSAPVIGEPVRDRATWLGLRFRRRHCAVHHVGPLPPLANSLFLPASAPRAPYSTLTGRETIGQQQIEFGTHLALLRVGNAAESYVLAAVRTHSELTRG